MLAQAFSALAPADILVIGDYFLDIYTFGVAKRISPEAPVAVIQAQKEEQRAGGAGNVVLNLLALGARVRAAGRLGDDIAGKSLRYLLEQAGGDVAALIVDSSIPTGIKNRIIAAGQQVVRIDHEKVLPLPHFLEQQVIDSLELLLADIALIAVSDYGKGYLTTPLLQALFSQAKSRGIPVIVDPKGTDFSCYRGATLIKPNRAESYLAARLPSSAPLEQAAAELLQVTDAEALLITCSEDGMALFSPQEQPRYFPVRVRQIKDVTGAGDTVLATVSLAVANGLSFEAGAQLANIAAGIAIEQVGCTTVSLALLAERLLELDEGNKIFDGGHLFILQAALQGKAIAVLSLGELEKLEAAVLRQIHSVKMQTQSHVLIWWSPKVATASEVRFLASLKDANYILLADRSAEPFCRAVAPASLFDWDAAAASFYSV